jgi:hypothetical protein
MKVLIIRTDGSEETRQIAHDALFEQIERLIGAALTDSVNLRDGRIMIVDDSGYETEIHEVRPGIFEIRCTKALKPVNDKATALYWSVCKPGTTHKIVGDVAIINTDEWEQGEVTDV